MIASIVGLMNSGKTLFMTYMLYLAWLQGKIILVNYDLNLPERCFKINKDFLFKLGKNSEILTDNIAMGFDELWIWLDARVHQQNTIATYFFNQSSKNDAEIYLTAQHNEQNDKRLRDNLHKVYQCNRVLYENGKFLSISDDKRFLPNNLLPKLYIKVIEFKRINLGVYTELVPIKTHYIPAMPIFRLYDTKQKITFTG